MSSPAPGLRFEVWNRHSIDDRETSLQLLQFLATSPFAPERWGVSEPLSQKFGGEQVEQVWERVLNTHHTHPILFLERRREPKCRYYLSWAGEREFIAKGTYNLLGEQIVQQRLLATWMSFTRSVPLHGAWMARWGTADEAHHYTRLNWTVPDNHPRLRPGAQAESAIPFQPLLEGIPDLFWANYFSPSYVEWLGPERMATLPALRKEETLEGGIFFTTAPSPWGWQARETYELKAQIRKHLGEDTVFDVESYLESVRQNLGKGNIYDPRQLVPRLRAPEYLFVSEHPKKSPSVEEIIQSQLALGFKMQERTERKLVFQNDNHDRVEIELGDEEE